MTAVRGDARRRRQGIGSPPRAVWQPRAGTHRSYRGRVALTETERAILDFEAEWTRHAGAKEEAIRATLGMGPARYYQLLGRLIDTADALEHDPLLVKRLRRVRDERVARRAAMGA